MRKSDFSYQLPDALIAQKPLEERSASRLLCLESRIGCLTDKKFTEFTELIDPGDLLIFNDTRVFPARLYGRKETGGKVEILIERILDDQSVLAHIRASKSPKSGTLLLLGNGISCIVTGRNNDLFKLKFPTGQTVKGIVNEIGHIPLPPYIDRADETFDHERYQTVFARHTGAVAAPTAGLHFDDGMIQKIRKRGAQTAFVTLHVGSGTFQPIRVENIAEHRMHSEYFEVTSAVADAVKKTHAAGGRVVAVGTTVLRALESASQAGSLQPLAGETDIFISPGYQFNCVDSLLTNFHLPESTLLTLVCAFAGYNKVMAAYQHAIEQSYRFYSYGDAMFLTRAEYC
ncbi:MAG: tRNA preQ1(34) S-adenosylmethionine ribosyltransferase-isomerase QueA [Methylococcales bacterium]